MTRRCIVALAVALAPFSPVLAQSAPAAPSPAVLTPPVPAPEPEPARLTAAKDLLAILVPESRREYIANQAVGSVNSMTLTSIMSSPFIRQGGAKDPDVQAAIKDFMTRRQTATSALVRGDLPAMLTAMERAYARRFTVAEMAEIKAFFLTPAGKAYAEQSQNIMADPDVVAWQQDLMKRVMADTQRDVPGLVAKFKAAEEKAQKAKADTSTGGKRK